MLYIMPNNSISTGLILLAPTVYTTPRMFADGTSLAASGETLSEVEKRANEDLRNFHNWLSANKLNLNIDKTEYVLIGSRHRIKSLDIQLSINIDK